LSDLEETISGLTYNKDNTKLTEYGNRTRNNLFIVYKIPLTKLITLVKLFG